MHQHNIEMFEHVQTLNWLIQACLQAVRAKFSHKVYNHKLPSPVTDFNKCFNIPSPILQDRFCFLYFLRNFAWWIGTLAHPKLIPSLMPHIWPLCYTNQMTLYCTLTRFWRSFEANSKHSLKPGGIMKLLKTKSW